MITGLSVTDPDLYETCTSSNFECHQLDVILSTYKGKISLSSRTNLEIISQSSSSLRLMANLNDLNNALKVSSHVYSFLDVTGLCSLWSTIWGWTRWCPRAPSNTLTRKPMDSWNWLKFLHLIRLEVSQSRESVLTWSCWKGYTSYDGFAKVSASNVSITIVAMNNAPYFSLLQPELSMQEGQQVSVIRVWSMFV